jgi:uncharacterized protein YndB with AHSA1/START domain
MAGKIFKSVAVSLLLFVLAVVVAWNRHTTMSIERTYNASATDVWRVFTDSDSIRKWWGPKGYTGVVARNDVREGGSYLWGMKSDRGKVYWSTGIYREVLANKRLVSTMSFANESGKAIPGSQVSVPGRWTNEITVTIEVREFGGKGRVMIKESGIPLIAYPLMKLGWAQQFDKMQALL